jgi:hypothetical protein
VRLPHARAHAVRLAVVAALGLGVIAGSNASAGSAHTYTAPFQIGPAGGDSFSYHSANANGSVTVGRAYPVPGAINCTKGGPFAKLLVLHHATGTVRKVVVSYDNAAIDNFTFATVGLREKHGRWYGSKTVRGLVAGSGTITLKPDRQRGHFPRTLVVEFGLQQSSACPNVDVGSMRFTQVTVSQ